MAVLLAVAFVPGALAHGRSAQTVAGGYSAVSAGGFHTCAIQAGSGSLVCWGDDSYGQASPPSLLGSRSGLPKPVLEERATLTLLGGHVRIKEHGAAGFVAMTQPTSAALGATVDAVRGGVQVIAATLRQGASNSVELWGGLLGLIQNGDGTLQARLGGDLSGCGPAGHGATTRHVWAKATGLLRTHGRYATVVPAGGLATTWLTQDRCAGTFVRVDAGAATVRDLSTHKSIHLRAGQTYLAKP